MNNRYGGRHSHAYRIRVFGLYCISLFGQYILVPFDPARNDRDTGGLPLLVIHILSGPLQCDLSSALLCH